MERSGLTGAQQQWMSARKCSLVQRNAPVVLHGVFKAVLPFEMAYGSEMNIQFMGSSSLDILEFTMPIVHSFNSCNIFYNVLCDKIAHFRVPFNCDHSKAHLCINQAVYSAHWYVTPVRWMNDLGQGEVLTSTYNVWAITHLHQK